MSLNDIDPSSRHQNGIQWKQRHLSILAKYSVHAVHSFDVWAPPINTDMDLVVQYILFLCVALLLLNAPYPLFRQSLLITHIYLEWVSIFNHIAKVKVIPYARMSMGHISLLSFPQLLP